LHDRITSSPLKQGLLPRRPDYRIFEPLSTRGKFADEAALPAGSPLRWAVRKRRPPKRILKGITISFFTPRKIRKTLTNKSNNITHLDTIQKSVFRFLKPLGFKKKGRTFNRQTENGVYQVINFQSGQFPLVDNYVIPGLRENYYGKFTINLGVSVYELDEINFPNKPKIFYQEYECQIRTRLPHLTIEQDYWWPISDVTEEIVKNLIEGLNEKGIPWLDTFETREKICRNWGVVKGSSLRAKLDVALIIFQTNKEKGTQLIQEYYNKIENHKPHKGYVKELAEKLGIKL
jgi:hypothetical protein